MKEIITNLNSEIVVSLALLLLMQVDKYKAYKKAKARKEKYHFSINLIDTVLIILLIYASRDYLSVLTTALFINEDTPMDFRFSQFKSYQIILYTLVYGFGVYCIDRYCDYKRLDYVRKRKRKISNKQWWIETILFVLIVLGFFQLLAWRLFILAANLFGK